METKQIQDNKEWYNHSYERMFDRANYEMRPSEFYHSLIGLFKPEQQSAILDVGCGPGQFCGCCANYKEFTAIYGIDISDTAIEYAKSAWPEPCKFLTSIAEKIEFPDKFFDYVTCIGSLEHFVDIPKALEEMKRVAKDDARFIILLPNRLFPFAETEQQEIAELLLTRKEWIKLLNDNGFKIIGQYKDYGAVKKAGWLSWAFWLYLKLMPISLTYGIIFEAVKYENHGRK